MHRWKSNVPGRKLRVLREEEGGQRLQKLRCSMLMVGCSAVSLVQLVIVKRIALKIALRVRADCSIYLKSIIKLQRELRLGEARDERSRKRSNNQFVGRG